MDEDMDEEHVADVIVDVDSSNANEYLVDPMHLLHVGKRERPVEIDVHVNWRRVGDINSRKCQWFWHDHSTTLTRRACIADPDALFTILTRCLPFAEWDYVFYGTPEFSHRIYELGRVRERELREDERAVLDWWSRAWRSGGEFDASLEGQERATLFAGELPSRCAETNMRSLLRDFMLREDGVARSRNRRWWFVVHRLSD
jgi:hypothetical protein